MERYHKFGTEAMDLPLFVFAFQVSFFQLQPAPPGAILKNSATPQRHQIETMPGGVAMFDFDGDGRLDLFFTNGAPQPSLKKDGPAWSNRLYRNLGGWRWEDVTEKTGLGGKGYDMGAAAADFDNDGRADLFITGVNGNTLYRNRGDGTFEDVTSKAGIKPSSWSIAAAWFDYDNDGFLDLFIVNYVKWNPATEPFCGDRQAGYRTYCHPKYYEPLPNSLYRNNGDGTFSDLSEAAGIARHLGKGMGVAVADIDGDGRMDVFVTNDTTPDFLFRNKGDGTFEEIGLQAGVALNEDGLALSSMGVDFRDVDGDGRPDLFVTALANETFPLFLNLGRGLFKDVTYPSKIAAQTLAYSGWSNGIYDFDNDGRADLFAANGDVNDNTERFSSRKSKLANLLLLNTGNGAFQAHEVGAPALHRGAAFGDLDGDGRIDIVVTRLNEAPLLLRNTMGDGRNWLTIELRGRKSNRDAIGAHIKLAAGGRAQYNHVTTSVGYASSSQKGVHFGLGAAAQAERIEIRWPGGQVQVLESVKANQRILVEEP
jgi:enediyne biosynthesis protein E4